MKHFRLVTRMARTTGTDLAAAHTDGDLSQEDWAEMVQTCRHCAKTGSCRAWLGRNETAQDPPDYCLNRTRFEAIRDRKAQQEGN